MPHTNFQGHRSLIPDNKIFLRFLPYMDMAAIWSCNISHFYSISLLQLTKAPHVILLQSAQRFLRKRSLKMLNLSDLGPRSMNDLVL